MIGSNAGSCPVSCPLEQIVFTSSSKRAAPVGRCPAPRDQAILDQLIEQDADYQSASSNKFGIGTRGHEIR
jgi:hypothetical protein